MKVPRFSIGWIMVFVAIVALDFGAIRACYLVPWSRNLSRGDAATVTRVELLARGSLPMANILAIGLLIGLRRHGSHPSLLGFEAFGTVALVLYTTSVCLVIANHRRYDYLAQLIRHHDFMTNIIENHHILHQIAVSVVLVLPQLAFALLGGFLSRMKLLRVRFTIRRVMVTVAIVALSIFAGITWQRRSHYQWAAGEFAQREKFARKAMVNARPNSWSKVRVTDPSGAEITIMDSRNADYYTRMREKYERAARRPWMIVSPVPLEPE